MSAKEGRPALGAEAATRTLERVPTSTIPEVWPNHLATVDLEKLCRKLDAAVKASSHLPPTGETEELMHAAAVARLALRRRRAHATVADARRALDESGWSA